MVGAHIITIPGKYVQPNSDYMYTCSTCAPHHDPIHPSKLSIKHNELTVDVVDGWKLLFHLSV